MAKPKSREKVVKAAGNRFRELLNFHDTAVLFSRYASFAERLGQAADDDARGLLFVTEYEFLDELYKAVFAEDFPRAKELVGGRTAELLKLFQEVLQSPLTEAPTEPTSGH